MNQNLGKSLWKGPKNMKILSLKGSIFDFRLGQRHLDVMDVIRTLFWHCVSAGKEFFFLVLSTYTTNEKNNFVDYNNGPIYLSQVVLLWILFFT